MGQTTMQILLLVPLAPVHWTMQPKNMVSLSMGMSAIFSFHTEGWLIHAWREML